MDDKEKARIDKLFDAVGNDIEILKVTQRLAIVKLSSDLNNAQWILVLQSLIELLVEAEAKHESKKKETQVAAN